MKDLPGAFDVRDQTAEMIESGAYDLHSAAKSLLWFLLFNGIYKPGSKSYGYVNPAKTARGRIAKMTGWSVSSINRGLAELETAGFIAREPRFEDGRQVANAIKLGHPDDWCFEHQQRGVFTVNTQGCQCG